MNTLKLLVCLLLVLKNVILVDSFIDPATVAVVSLIAGGVSYLYRNPDTREGSLKFGQKVFDKACQMVGLCEGCEEYWIPANLQGLEYELKSEIFGQSLAVEMILSALKSHLNNKNPRRSLVLSFQGSPGTGKNFISKKILKNMFKLGDSTKYVTFYRGSSDFPLKSGVDRYKAELVQDIREKVYQCHRSVFVFDEIEKMPNGILDVVSNFVRAGKEGDYDYRRVIFILLSNVGSEALTQEALTAWKRGIHREDMNTRELTRLLTTESYNSEGGLKQTGLVKNQDISHFVPFLPLDRHHIVQCLERYVVTEKNQIMSPELTELVLEEMIFFPENERMFSSSGCKRVAEVADYLIEKETRRKRKRGLN